MPVSGDAYKQPEQDGVVAHHQRFFNVTRQRT
jgi:hypothetical protein